jgi:hypothetical protein
MLLAEHGVADPLDGAEEVVCAGRSSNSSSRSWLSWDGAGSGIQASCSSSRCAPMGRRD